MRPQTGPAWGPDRWTAVACLAITVGVGVVVFLETVVAGLPGPESPAWWWSSYLLLLVVQLVTTDLLPRPRLVPAVAWLPLLVGLALVTFLLYPNHGSAAGFLIVSAAAVARYASTWAVVGVIAVQTAAATAAVAAAGWPPVDMVAAVLGYSGFQAFGALLVRAARRETEARRQLAETHAELQAAVARLEAASRDAERLRIARDLHDLVGHQLTALALELEVASHLVDDATGAENVRRARTAAKDLLADVRVAVTEMRAGAPALEARLAAMARNLPGLEVSVRVAGSDLVDADRTHALLRVAQESITNTLRHADASRLEIIVTSDLSGTHLRVVDNGRGVAELVPGHGLTGMRERMEALGGSLAIGSSPGAGFSIDAHLPGAAGSARTTDQHVDVPR